MRSVMHQDLTDREKNNNTRLINYREKKEGQSLVIHFSLCGGEEGIRDFPFASGRKEGGKGGFRVFLF